MAGRIDARLRELGIELPEARAPKVARIKGANIAGPFLFVSGQVPQWNGEMPFIGKVGREFTVEQGAEAARLCALNVIAHARAALEFIDAPKCVNGASDLMVEIFGEAGAHARTVAGVTVMPFDVAIEVEADFLIE